MLKRHKSFSWMWVLFAIVLVSIFAFIKRDLFQVKEITGNLVCVPEEEIGYLKGKLIFTLDQKEIEDKLKNHLCVKAVAVERVYPNKLNINVEQRQAVMQVKVVKKVNVDELIDREASPSSQSSTILLLGHAIDKATESGRFLVDNTGVLFQAGQANLPEGVFSGDFGLGDSLGQDLTQKFLLTHNGLKGLNVLGTLQVSEVVLISSGEQRIFFGLNKEIKRQLASLQLILEEAKINSKVMNTIDLRFNKPYVVYSPKKKS